MFRVICTTTSKFLYANGYIKKTSPSNLQLKGSLLNLGFSITPPQSQNHFKTSFRCHISQCSLHLTNLKNMQRTELPTINSKKIASKNPGTSLFPSIKKHEETKNLLLLEPSLVPALRGVPAAFMAFYAAAEPPKGVQVPLPTVPSTHRLRPVWFGGAKG